MNKTALEMILAKRAGGEHAPEDVARFVNGYVQGLVPDYQVAAWLMAVCWRGMTPAETAALTRAMADSGERLDLSSLKDTVDKHSTGGVGDKTTLVVTPLLAAVGATVAKMSGRGLGHTGGTVDKLESIPGFQVDLSERDFFEQAKRIGVVVTGQSKDLAPADGLIYALRDTTGTVESLPLIASSIMSKKLAGGARAVVLDVKVGSGAFMKSEQEAFELARLMVDIGQRGGLNVRAVLSAMDEPLGRTVGNALEVDEAVRCLQGEGPPDLLELSLVLAEEVLEGAGMPAGREQLEEAVSSGRAYTKLQEWVEAQGGDPRSLGRLERAPDTWQLTAKKSGVLVALDALGVGRAAGALGAGRTRKGESVDHGVGVQLHAKTGDIVEVGQPLATLYHRGGRGLPRAIELMHGAVRVGEEAPVRELIIKRGIGA